jgi:hypothetical protein
MTATATDRRCTFGSGSWRCRARKAIGDGRFCPKHAGGKITPGVMRGCGCARGQNEWKYCPYCGKELPPKEMVSYRGLREENEALRAELVALRVGMGQGCASVGGQE